jgi:hypothetical protein
MQRPFAALLHDLAKAAWKARIERPVQDHMADRELAVIGLAARLVVDVEGQALEVGGLVGWAVGARGVRRISQDDTGQNCQKEGEDRAWMAKTEPA